MAITDKEITGRKRFRYNKIKDIYIENLIIRISAKHTLLTIHHYITFQLTHIQFHSNYNNNAK